ncbi:rho GTPase-activating protein 24-like [Littorina saxatilis]|uniref:Uncharacterized protein n=1 Tax=Littorina saxatilis TaxID=31220 RepID=A0AAN9BV57_9CAEN
MEEPGLKFILGKPLRGWLRRQGGMMRGWQRRFFVLQENCLFAFTREDDTRVSHTYLLDDYQLKEVPTSCDDPDKFAFELVSEKSNGDSVTLCAASDEERKEWVKALCYHIYSGKGGAIFGTPLEVTMKHEHQHGRNVPYILKACVEHLDKYAMEAEGIFRLAGRAGLLKELRAKFETGQRPSLEDVDVHTVASLLKAYLREMPESLVPPNLYQRAMNCAMRYADASSAEARAAEVALLAKLLEELPDVKYTTLAFICRFLHRLAANSDKTKMDTRNLSLVFGPNLIRHMDNNPELMMLTADLTQHLAYMIIQHCPDVLPLRSDREGVPSKSQSSNSPHLRKKNPVLNAVATADLLRLSQPVDVSDPSLLIPATRPNALGDLAGLDFTSQQGEVFDNSQTASPSTGSFVFVSDHFEGRRDGSTSSEASGGQGTLERGLTGIRGPKPIPPKRTKSRTLRSRRSAVGPPSPKSPEPSRHLDSGDILKALSTSGHIQGNDSQSTEGDDGFPAATSRSSPGETRKPAPNEGKGGGENTDPQTDIKQKTGTSKFYVSTDASASDSKGINGDVTFVSGGSKSQQTEGTSDVKAEATSSDNSSRCSRSTGKVGPSHSDLEVQVTALKTELINNKQRSDRLVNALKSQLTEIRSKYEARISSLEKQHRRQVLDLTTKLDAERNARAEAVERTVNLQAQLYKYKLQYGELRDSQ